MRLYVRKNRFGPCLLLLTGTVLLAGCDVSWVSQATSIINVLVPAILGMLGVISTFGVGITPDLLSTIQKAGQEARDDLQNVVLPLIQSYNDAPDSDKENILEQINTALNGVNAKFADILSALHVSNPDTQKKLAAVVGAVQSEILALINIIPVVKGLKTVSQFEAEGGHVPLNAGQFKHHFNAVLASQFGDEASGFKLH